jgi:serine/threonine protein kinase
MGTSVAHGPPLISGAYGVVCAAKNRETNAKVAIKKITPMCATTVDGKHTLREIRMMRWLGKHPNIISLKDLCVNVEEDELYVVMELMDTDLHRIIQSPQPLGDAVSALLNSKPASGR